MKCTNCQKEMKDFSSKAKPSRLKYLCDRQFDEKTGKPLENTGCGHVLNMINQPWHDARDKARLEAKKKAEDAAKKIAEDAKKREEAAQKARDAAKPKEKS